MPAFCCVDGVPGRMSGVVDFPMSRPFDSGERAVASADSEPWDSIIAVIVALRSYPCNARAVSISSSVLDWPKIERSMSYGVISDCCAETYSGAAAFKTLVFPADDEILSASSLTSQSTFSVWNSPYISCAGVVSLANSYALRFGLLGITGAAKASRGDGRGDEKGETVEDLVLLRLVGMKPGGASGLTPKRGDPDTGVAEPRHEAGDGRRRMVCRMGGGEVALPPVSRCRHNASSTALSRDEPVRVVSLLSNSSSLSVLSSSSIFGSCRIGRHSSYVSSETMMTRLRRSGCSGGDG